MSVSPGDQARVSVLVEVSPDEAFRIFTQEIDQWWRRGLAYRAGGRTTSVLHLEGRVGGKLFETIDSGGSTRVVQTGHLIVWEPPARLVFERRATNFAPDERTEVEVCFEASRSGTLVTVTHRGWSRIRPDHPARHGHDVPAFVRMMGLWWGDLMSSLRVYAATRASTAR